MSTPSRPVAFLPRPGTPSGVEIRGHLCRLIQRIRQHWPHTRITIRGGSHYSRPELMAWCEWDIRYVVTTLKGDSAAWHYDTLYYERGQAENLSKPHKSQLASDRTSCRLPLASKFRLILHTAAYGLMLAVRDAIPKAEKLAGCAFTTPRMRLIEIAARVTETATRVRIAFATACPEAGLFRSIAHGVQIAGPVQTPFKKTDQGE